MPRISQLSRSRAIHDASIASSCVLDFLAPAVDILQSHRTPSRLRREIGRRCASTSSSAGIEAFFYTALAQASQCEQHGAPRAVGNVFTKTSLEKDKGSDKEQRRASRGRAGLPMNVRRDAQRREPANTISQPKNTFRTASTHGERDPSGAGEQSRDGGTDNSDRRYKQDALRKRKQQRGRIPDANNRLKLKITPSKVSDDRRLSDRVPTVTKLALSDTGIFAANLTLRNTKCLARSYHTSLSGFKSKKDRFAEGTHLPPGFFDDVSVLSESTHKRVKKDQTISKTGGSLPSHTVVSSEKSQLTYDESAQSEQGSSDPRMKEQIKLLNSVRELEEKLEKAKTNLAKSITKKVAKTAHLELKMKPSRLPVVLSKEDYMNLVDLYYYSHNSRFSPEATDNSPTPLVLNDYSFTLSSDFTPGSTSQETVNEDESYESPLKRIDEMLRERQLREIAVMQVFVDLLLDDASSNRALYEAYKQLPEPGVAYLPKGIVRLFLQRMSTPWTLSEKSMLRYLALVDDMQRAQLPITVAEWSSAIYLAGRAFSSVTKQEVNRAFHVWNAMEREAGIKGSHVTFNILFDIAVRSGSFALGETILREMHSRNLRLNRLGRVSLIYYHGLRKDGDGVRKAYRDFVEAGEIVDTLVLNCVIASLLNAQEPQAAEQVYARMKNIQLQLRKGFDQDGGEALYKHHPDPGGNTIDLEMASNYLGRVLERAPRLKNILPEHHQELQARMPLTPDHMTFRSMVAYHATTSGDLDRLTVLLQEMTDTFHLPLQTIFFQLLFKGFAFHGPVGGPQSAWSTKRLDLCWNACRSAIKASDKGRSLVANVTATQDASAKANNGETNVLLDDSILPSAAQVNAMPPHAPLPNENPPLSRPQPRRLSDWSEFVLDLAAFPRERLKRLERFHSTMFDAEDVVEPHDKPGIHTYRSPYFQSNAYTAPEPHLDSEEGEYELPNPAGPGLLHDADKDSEPRVDSENDEPESSPQPVAQSAETAHQVVATRALVCWLLRAYARNTKSRYKVEEVWNSVRKIYRPRDASERESVVRVLRRCLRDCDREGGN